MAKAAKTKKAVSDKSKFSVIKKIREATGEVSERVKEYNDKYVAKPLEKGKDTLKEYNEKYVVKTIEKGRDYFEEPYKKLTGKVDDILAKGRDIEKDALDKLDELFDNGKKIAYKLPMVETIEKKVTEGLNALPSLVNMPSRGEIEKLTDAMEKLNSNLKTLKAIETL